MRPLILSNQSTGGPPLFFSLPPPFCTRCHGNTDQWSSKNNSFISCSRVRFHCPPIVHSRILTREREKKKRFFSDAVLGTIFTVLCGKLWSVSWPLVTHQSSFLNLDRCPTSRGQFLGIHHVLRMFFKKRLHSLTYWPEWTYWEREVKEEKKIEF